MIGGPNDLTITWYKASQVIGLTYRIEVETKLRNSTLTIQDVSEEDEGNYTCYAAWVFYFLSEVGWWQSEEIVLSRGVGVGSGERGEWGNSVVKLNLSIRIISV